MDFSQSLRKSISKRAITLAVAISCIPFGAYSAELEEVVVTARKRQESLQEAEPWEP